MRIRALLVCGVLGGLVYLGGDLLLYGALGDGASFHSLPVMATRSDDLLVLGGAVAPLGTFLYLLGGLGLSRALVELHPRASQIFLACWAGVFIAGASYHATFSVLGFAAKVSDDGVRRLLLSQIRTLLTAIYSAEVVCGVAGTLMLAFLLWRSPARWLILLMPTAWTLLDFLPRMVPAPLGALFAGGWINGWFTIFFAAALGAFGRSPAGCERESGACASVEAGRRTGWP